MVLFLKKRIAPDITVSGAIRSKTFFFELMDLSTEDQVLSDQPRNQEETKDAQEYGDRAGLFFFRDLLGQLRQGFVNGEGDFQLLGEAVA